MLPWQPCVPCYFRSFRCLYLKESTLSSSVEVKGSDGSRGLCLTSIFCMQFISFTLHKGFLRAPTHHAKLCVVAVGVASMSNVICNRAVKCAFTAYAWRYISTTYSYLSANASFAPSILPATPDYTCSPYINGRMHSNTDVNKSATQLAVRFGNGRADTASAWEGGGKGFADCMKHANFLFESLISFMARP